MFSSTLDEEYSQLAPEPDDDFDQDPLGGGETL